MLTKRLLGCIRGKEKHLVIKLTDWSVIIIIYHRFGIAVNG